jgi:hexosaminidase
MIAAVFDAVLPLFPGAYVHIGGDESPITEWHASPFAQQVMQEHHLADEHQLQSWFIQRVEQLLTQRGKRLIGWDEIQEGGLSPTATMMVWRNWKWATAALAHGNDVVMSPTTHTYFDYSQGPHPDSPLFQTIGGNLPLEKVYTFEPIPEGTASERIMQVLGCQGQLWSEYIWSMPKLEYMAWPRACALAEVAWSAPAARAWPSFTQRLAGQAPLLERMGIDYRTNDGSPALPERSLALTPHAPASR